ncbi:hypothetical protein D7V94_01820 [Parablautia intestinalis]|uniref:Uncharacterized protein n=1 Tax=Parablautia intestinalis TaxID=2320100 RepID=A0A3A9B686_9FIRM|nr:hypothetical protein [Parablautia intestinalis]RKI94305.1 hypothetical protein D7V94_01820 [Parablautia intestinalis]
MGKIQVVTTIAFEENGVITSETKQEAAGVINIMNNGSNEAESDTTYLADNEEVTEEEAERYAVASDLANVCEYLEESEVIKIRLIINKAEKRKSIVEKE